MLDARHKLGVRVQHQVRAAKIKFAGFPDQDNEDTGCPTPSQQVLQGKKCNHTQA